MSNIGILAYGSLMVNSGKEIQSRIDNIKDALTPFKVEFARKSKTRNYAPTLIPVKEGGAKVRAKILVLKEEVSLEEAKDMLYRRETHEIYNKKKYSRPAHPNPNEVFINEIEDFHGVKIVLYTEIGKNINNPTPKKLAELAIESACSTAGKKREDGIRYLIDAKFNGIKTPFMPEYEKEILKQTNTKSLHQAWEVSAYANL